MAIGIKTITIHYKNGQKDTFTASDSTKRLCTERFPSGDLAVIERGSGTSENVITVPFDSVKRIDGKSYNEA